MNVYLHCRYQFSVDPVTALIFEIFFQALQPLSCLPQGLHVFTEGKASEPFTDFSVLLAVEL
jgi:hypothetical protein